jgi:hypothetical protein
MPLVFVTGGGLPEHTRLKQVGGDKCLTMRFAKSATELVTESPPGVLARKAIPLVQLRGKIRSCIRFIHL